MKKRLYSSKDHQPSHCNRYHPMEECSAKNIIYEFLGTNERIYMMQLNHYLHKSYVEWFLFFEQILFSHSVSYPKDKIKRLYSIDASIDTKLYSNLVEITFENNFNHPLDLLPPSLRFLHCGNMFHHPLPKLPLKLEHLHCSKEYNFPLCDLPDGLLFLFCGWKYNHPLTHLPNSLIVLHCGHDYNHPLVNLPLKLQHLRCSDNYDYPLNELPHSLRSLDCGSRFNQPLLCLPPTLTSLKCSTSYQHPLPSLPKSLTALVYRNVDLLPNVPSSIVWINGRKRSIPELP